MSNTNGVSLDSPEFAEAKTEFDIQLQETLRNMLAHGHTSASLSLKLNIVLTKCVYDNSPVTFPRFEAKITSTIQQKAESSSTFGGNNTALVYSEHDKAVYMVEPATAAGQQVSFFDQTGDE